MSINISGKHTEVGESLNNHITAGIENLSQRYFGEPIEAHVVIEKGRYNFVTDLSLHLSKNFVVRTHAEDADAYRSFDLASEKIETRIKRYKSRLRDRKRNHAEEMIPALQYTISQEHEDQGGDTPLVIAEMGGHIPTLTVSEAVMEMDLGDHPALMFKNKKHGGFNVVYRRQDGHIGWIDPQNKT